MTARRRIPETIQTQRGINEFQTLTRGIIFSSSEVRTADLSQVRKRIIMLFRNNGHKNFILSEIKNYIRFSTFYKLLKQQS